MLLAMKINPAPSALEYGQLPVTREYQALRFVKRGAFIRIVALVGLFFFMLAMSFVSVGLILSRGLSGKK